MAPEKYLAQGADLLELKLNQFGFHFAITHVGRGSGGPFAEGAFTKGDQQICLWVRFIVPDHRKLYVSMSGPQEIMIHSTSKPFPCLWTSVLGINAMKLWAAAALTVRFGTHRRKNWSRLAKAARRENSVRLISETATFASSASINCDEWERGLPAFRIVALSLNIGNNRRCNVKWFHHAGAIRLERGKVMMGVTSVGLTGNKHVQSARLGIWRRNNRAIGLDSRCKVRRISRGAACSQRASASWNDLCAKSLSVRKAFE
jgi:hypothetical protein